jgi:AraC-like DNA-binding protein
MKTAEIEQPKPAMQNNAGYQVESCESEAVRKIEQSITYMLRHLDESLQVATLAAQANISASHFFALFKRRIGCAPIDYFIRLRMQHACRLLDETVLSVKEVAATLGYDDPFYFSRIFKSVNHVAPREYRLLKNGAKEAVRNGGIGPHFFHPQEPGTGLEHTGSYSILNGSGVTSRSGINGVAVSGCRNGEKG